MTNEEKFTNVTSRELESNEDLVQDLMTFSPYGALAQIFICDAIMKAAERVVAAGRQDATGISLIHPDAWFNTAKDIKERCDKFYGRHG